MNHRIQNFVIICTMLALGIFVVSFGIVLKKNGEDARAKDLKISVLIDEVGELRERVDRKEQVIEEMYGYISGTSEELTQINSKIQKEIQGSAQDWAKVKSELSTSNQQLTTLLKEKEKIISNLAQKNQNLQRELSIPKHDPSILDILIVGHNAKLTDTMLLASVNPVNNTTTLVSIPRDLYHKGRKINELYSKYGVKELQRAVAEVTGIYPEKYIIFNFESFEDLIDSIGGIEIEVQKRIVDNAYPGPNNSYTIVAFEPGTHHMDGATALKYARSRKSTSDFDRAERQQQVIEAVKQKAKELNIISRLDLATKLYAKVKDNIRTNINLFEGLSYAQHYQNYSVNTGTVLSTQNYLYSTRSSQGQYILLPRSGTYASIKEFIHEAVNS